MCIPARFWRLWAGLLLLPFGLMLGCGGSSKGTVSGKVLYKGQPLKGGNVAILSKAGGGNLTSSIQEDGSYSISKVPRGPAVITVETRSIRPVPQKALPGPYARASKDTLPPGLVVGDAARYVPIPEQYADPEKSGLSLDVKGGPQPHDIDLK